jgi:hypothetical protein
MIRAMTWTTPKKAAVVGIASLLVVGATLVFVFRKNISERMSLSAGRSALASKKAEVLDLSSYSDIPVSAFDARINSPRPQFVCLPRGFQTFFHVPLQIDGIKCLWGSGVGGFDEELIGIPVNKKFETLYVCHCAFYGSPPKTPVYDLVFRYADGSSVTNRILYSVDVLDWFGTGGPTGTNSRLAWKDVCTAGGKTQPLRLCLTALENPQPNTEVASIDLYSCKSQTSGCILAMTPGKSGLMHE